MDLSITLTHIHPVAAGPAPEQVAEERMQKYAEYINELYERHPKTFGKLKNFIDRGNCVCSTEYNCACTTIGMICTCKKAADGHDCQCGKGSSRKEQCNTRRVEHQVRIYDLDRSEATSGDFWKFLRVPEGGRENQDYYNAGNPDEFNKLKRKLWDHYDNDSEAKRNGSAQHCRLITVNHLSANVAKLLGGRYDIPGDFFNRHLPGTEAISGRLISRLTSALQVDFDELYESSEKFSDLWRGWNMLDGHDIISESLRQNFLFYEHVGWDYFPTAQDDWLKSQNNTPMSSGTEAELENVFQFNLTHRVSIYSNPPHHSSTAIMIFYPLLPVCHNSDHYHLDSKGKQCHTWPTPDDCKPVDFRAVPDTVPQMSTVTKPSPEDRRRLHQRTMPKDTGIYLPDEKGHRKKAGVKWDYARAFDREFRIQAQEFWERIQYKKREDPTFRIENHDFSFVDLFGVPLFRIIASNWARLVERRTLDLRQLEWRPTRATGIDTVQGIKSRRIAIARHQKCINSCLAVLRNLRQEERVRRFKEELAAYKTHHSHRARQPEGSADLIPVFDIEVIKSTYIDGDDHQYNKGLSNGLVGTEKDDEFTWDRVYYDFFELKASMDALANRADKIQEGIIGLLSIKISQNSSMLSWIGFVFSLVIIPFTIVCGLFSIDFDDGQGFPKGRLQVGMAFLGAVLGVLLIDVVLYYSQRLFEARDTMPLKVKHFKGDMVALRERIVDWLLGLDTGESGLRRRSHSRHGRDTTSDESDESV
ncbi:hypothetical protein QBC34DRAFT_441512 [Podospora aff. communis PSN243]|uniref:Uncharacterized protein n=1 Tax=Podospora aff. communis PSN243 TaxID=3040156 RepID=A0AAV9GDE0_9PEZI|nr:hypothetical protein QBC34DRAFT_441512 [Podospora aff. communis PSN243]